MSAIAFVLATYHPDEPAGFERATAGLAAGARELGYTPLIIAAGPATDRDAADPALIRLNSFELMRPVLTKQMRTALDDPEPICREIREILAAHKATTVFWADALYGLGYLAPTLPEVPGILMVHKVRDDDFFTRAVQQADAVCPVSPFLAMEAANAGHDVSSWHVVPNPLLNVVPPVTATRRESLRTDPDTPIRIVARAEPYKGVAELLEALPPRWSRPVEVVLAEAGFEYWPGMQKDVIAACHAAAEKRPDVIRILPGKPWREIPEYFAGAAATIISTYEPETFCLAAAEAMSVGTPVIGFGLGNIPHLLRQSGTSIPLEAGYGALWLETQALIENATAYHDSSLASIETAAEFAPTRVMRQLLATVHPTV